MSAIQRRAKGSSGSKPVHINYDNPAHHGWTVRRIDDDGVKVWELIEDETTLAALKPVNDGWAVAILPNEPQPEWLNVTLGSEGFYELTETVKRLAGVLVENRIFASGIDWDGDPKDCQPDPDTIPFDGRPAYYPEGIF